MNWIRTAVALLVVVGSCLLGGVAAAQADSDDGPAITAVAGTEGGTEDASGIDFDENQAGIDRARRTLITIAAVMTVALVAYWWHTIPSRRLRVASRRLADQRAVIQKFEADDTADSVAGEAAD